MWLQIFLVALSVTVSVQIPNIFIFIMYTELQYQLHSTEELGLNHFATLRLKRLEGIIPSTM